MEYFLGLLETHKFVFGSILLGLIGVVCLLTFGLRACVRFLITANKSTNKVSTVDI